MGKFKKEKSFVNIYHVGSITKVEQGEYVNPCTIKTKTSIYLSLVTPTEVKNKGKFFPALIHYKNEIFLRDFNYNCFEEKRKQQFIIEKGLFRDITKEYNLAIKENKQVFCVKDDNKDIEIKITDSKIITIDDNRKIILYSLEESEYLRYETALFEDSHLSYQLVKAMKKDAKSGSHELMKDIIYFGTLILIVFFLSGGITLLKFW